MTIATVTPLKADSERVPGKNFKELAGKPLYMYVTEKMLALQDDFETQHFIYCDARTWNMIDQDVKNWTTWLPEKLAGSAPDSNIFFRDMACQVPSYARHIMFANATSPFVKMETYRKCIESVIHGGFDSACTAIKVRGRLWNDWNQSINHDPQTCPRTQSQDPVWIESDGAWVVQRDIIQDDSRRVGFRPKFIDVDQIEQLDINWPRDFEIAEALISAVGY